jgi:sensor histidine kinase YesM
MFSKYNMRWGILFSLTIAVLASIPSLIRLNIGQFVISLLLLSARILICWFVHHFFLLYDNRNSFRKPSPVRVFASIAVGAVLIFGVALFRGESFPGFGLAHLRIEQVYMINLFRSAVISAFTYFVVYYLQVNIRLQHSLLENEYLKQDQLKAQLFSLQQQLSPHFLFNSLSTLRTIAPDAGTKTYVMQLAHVYRYLLTLHDSQKITVRDELAFTKSYLYILQERFEDALQVSMEIGEDFENYTLPPLTLQILIENALKHNVLSVDQPLRLRIYTDADTAGCRTLTIENSYQPKLSVEESTGTGLQNINYRYELLAGKKIRVRKGGSLFIVSLPLLEP